MSNQLHVILRNRPDVVTLWSDQEVARRWLAPFPGRENGWHLPRDNSHSHLAFREFALDCPAKVKVKIGLTASNLSRKPFPARFADFVLLDDKLKVEELFGE
jgi:hypothetical protein